MKLEEVRDNWNRFGEQDPLWAILLVAPDGSPWTLEDFLATGVAEVDAVVTQLQGLGVEPGGRALDFGCGVGRLTQAMGDHFDACDGVDIAESMVTRARELNRHGSRCSYHLNTRADLSPFADGTFDFVYSSIVLQHMEPRYSTGYLLEFLRVLRPGGVAVFQLPSRRLAQAPAAANAGGVGIRGTLRRIVPAGARARVRALRPGPRTQPAPRAPVMEMHWVPRAEVEALVTGAGGEILEVGEDHSCGPGYESFRYFARAGSA